MNGNPILLPQFLKVANLKKVNGRPWNYSSPADTYDLSKATGEDPLKVNSLLTTTVNKDWEVVALGLYLDTCRYSSLNKQDEYRGALRAYSQYTTADMM